MDRSFFVTADSWGNAPAVEMFDPEPRAKSLVLANNGEFGRFVSDISQKGNFWLPAAAEELNISPNIKDYVVVPTVSMPSDLPNRNKMAFPLEQLTGWLPDIGMPMYQSWIGMPTFYEHNNSDYTKAKGIVFDCKMVKMKGANGDIWKVLKLLGFDRTRDAILANSILTGERTCYSMGANANDFSCSVCGSLNSKGMCEHLSPVGKQAIGPNPFKEFSGVLAFYNVLNPKGFEVSSVATPAYVSASSTKPFNW